jgi:adenylosuccinate lyase
MIDRYSTGNMTHVWDDSAKYFLWAEIEMCLARAMHNAKMIDDKALNDILNAEVPTAEEVKAQEEKCKHEMIAFLTAFGSKMPESSARWIHYGLTSSDVIDTAQAIMVKDGLELIVNDCGDVINAISDKVKLYRELPCIGRTHGQIAEPTTYGLRFHIWRLEILDAIYDIKMIYMGERMAKISGAVGTSAHIYRFRNHMVEELGRSFGLRQDPCQTQIVSRHHYSKVVFSLAQLMSAFEKICLNIRLLQSSGIGEIYEHFSEEQKGSSAMPHKKNPISCEQLCGLARVVRSYVAPMMETNATWLERDLTNSSLERVILPDIFNLVHYSVISMTRIINGLLVNTTKTNDNLFESRDKWPSQSMMLTLVRLGMNRDEAYKAYKNGVSMMHPDMTGKEFDEAESIEKHVIAASLRIPKL